MAVEWVTAAIVRDFLGNLNGKGSIPDAEIEEVIEQNEGFMETILKVASSLAYDNAKKPHKSFRKIVALLSTLQIVGRYAISYSTLDYAVNVEDVLKDELDRIMNLYVSNPSYTDFVKEA